MLGPFFSKKKSKNKQESKAKPSLFGKIRNNTRFTAGTQSTHHLNNQEPMFYRESDSSSYETTSFAHDEPLPNSDSKTLGEIADYENQRSDFAPNVNEQDTAPAQSSNEDVPLTDDHNYYTYRADESYLNEEGRDSDHLYIGPGEPLTPKKMPRNFPYEHSNGEVSGEPVYEHTGDDNTDMTTPPSFATQNTKQNINVEVVNNSKTKITATSSSTGMINNGMPQNENENTMEDSPYITPGARQRVIEDDDNEDSPYISPGAPKRFPGTRYIKPEEVDSTSPYITPGSHQKSIVEEKRDPDEPIYIVPGAEGARLEKERQARLEKERQEKALAEKLRLEKERQTASGKPQQTINADVASKATTSDLFVENSTVSANGQEQGDLNITSPHKIDHKAIFANVKNNMPKIRSTVSQPDNNAQNKGKGISLFFLIMLSIRQIFASFFQYTSLGIVFSRQARSFFGPSQPIYMPIPYFAVGFICALFTLFMTGYAKPALVAELGVILYIILIGCDAFRGIGKLLEAFSQRRIDNYTVAVVVIIFVGVITTVLEYYLEEQHLDFCFCLTIGAICLLSALCATSFNYGSKVDPISSFGTMSIFGLIFAIICSLVVTFLILQWQVAFSMIGICAFVRLLIGQYIYARNISASTHIICAVQFITLLLLMVDLLFVSHAFEVNTPIHLIMDYLNS